MPRPSHRVRLRRLLFLPLLLLVPLGVLKWRLEWRAEHPPVTSSDRILRSTIERGSVLYIVGNAVDWSNLTGLEKSQGFLIKDRAIMEHLTTVLRCTERGSRDSLGHFDVSITFGILTSDHQTHRPRWTQFEYWRNAKGSYLWEQSNNQVYADWDKYLIVEPRFAPRFEALVAQLAQRAKAKGSHPEIVLQPIPWHKSP